jgi:hypothetical protein
MSSRIGSRSNSHDPEEPDAPFRIGNRVKNTHVSDRSRQGNGQRGREEPARPVFQIGGSIIRSGTSTPSSPTTGNGTHDALVDHIELGHHVRQPDSGATSEQPSSSTSVTNRIVQDEADLSTRSPLQNHGGNDAV